MKRATFEHDVEHDAEEESETPSRKETDAFVLRSVLLVDTIFLIYTHLACLLYRSIHPHRYRISNQLPSSHFIIVLVVASLLPISLTIIVTLCCHSVTCLPVAQRCPLSYISFLSFHVSRCSPHDFLFSLSCLHVARVPLSFFPPLPLDISLR